MLNLRHGILETTRTYSTLLNKLSAYWKFEDVSCYDIFRVLDGSIVGAVTFVPGKINNSATFYANGIRITVPDSNIWTFTADACSFSFFSWVLLSAEQPGSYSQVFGSNVGTAWSFQMNKTAHPSYRLLIYDGAALTSDPLTFDMSTWYHVGFIKSNRNLAFYRNGVKVKDVSTTGSGNPTGMTFGDDSLSEPFRGQIDESGHWNRVLTESEVTELYNSGKGKSFPF